MNYTVAPADDVMRALFLQRSKISPVVTIARNAPSLTGLAGTVYVHEPDKAPRYPDAYLAGLAAVKP